MKKVFAAVLATLFLVAGVTYAAGKWPWRRRIGRDVETLHLTAHRNTPIEIWPAEPSIPEYIDPAEFERSLGELCNSIRKVPTERLKRYSGFILESADQFEVDPFLLAALMYDQSKCWPATPKRDSKVGHWGLTRIPFKMHARQTKKNEYTWYSRDNERWIPHVLNFEQYGNYRFNPWQAAKPQSNIFFAAGFLSILKAQEKMLDSQFESVPHRHYVSHWFYGDRVRQVEPENRVLTARRRLLVYYAKTGIVQAGDFEGTPIVSPMDGVPRLVLDYFGNKRGKKTGYGHRGIDINCAVGEPIRAVAAGRVTFSGVDETGSSNHKIMEPKEANKLINDQMGPGGLYVTINHGNNFGTFYMHLKSISVKYQAQVTAGQIIGTCGRSGTKTPGDHLHLEFRKGTGRVDPAASLASVLVNPH